MTSYKKYICFLILNDMEILSKRLVNKCVYEYVSYTALVV